MKVRDGDWVPKGTVLATLSNPEKIRERMVLQEQQAVNFHKALWFGHSSDRESRAMSRQHQQMATDLEPALDKVIEQIGKLTLIAERDGKVMGVPHRETTGQWLKTGNPFCEIADPHKLEAHMILDQSDIDLVRRDRRAWIKIYGDSEITRRSYVADVAPKNRDEIPAELSNLAGGEIATKQDEKTGKVKPLTAVYEVIIPIDNRNLALQPGLRGFAKIDGGTHTLGWWLWRLITKTFHFTL